MPRRRPAAETPLVEPTALPALEQGLDTERMKAENERLHAEIAALREANARQSAALARQARMAGEIELLRNAILNNVSHEMKTPLLHVKAAVSNLKEEFPDNRLIDYATTATTRLEGIIRNITLLADSTEIRRTPAPIRDSLDQALRSLRRSWEHKDQVERVRTMLEADLPPVLIDPQAMGIAIQLLIDNALKFSRNTVDVRIRRQRQGVRIEISDTGIGIPADELQRIFEPFYQVDSSSTRRFGGMGIGLAIVRLILERHDIQIDVKSKPQKGSTFAFTLPPAPPS
ncbi:MAG: HAMP domain-containing sensor histidine kinase [bacterium]|nr:HAMP domain-containing sensor histidine kinase [bacterium]